MTKSPSLGGRLGRLTLSIALGIAAPSSAGAEHNHGSINGALVAAETAAARPWPRTEVRLLRIADGDSAVEVGSRLANPDGTFQFCGLPVPARYRVQIEADGYDRIVEEVALTLATPRVPRLRLRPASRFEPRDEISASGLRAYDTRLDAFDEPPLCAPRKGTKASYRLLWLRENDRPIVLRIEFGKGGEVAATYKVDDPDHELTSETIDLVALHAARGGGGYVAGRVGPQARESFWDEPYRIDRRPEADPERRSTWVLEGVKDGRCHVTERWSPEESDPPRRFAESLLLEIAEIRLFYDEVY